jgi:hypothetical protein
MPIMCDVGLIVKKVGVSHVENESKKVSQKKRYPWILHGWIKILILNSMILSYNLSSYLAFVSMTMIMSVAS